MGTTCPGRTTPCLLYHFVGNQRILSRGRFRTGFSNWFRTRITGNFPRRRQKPGLPVVLQRRWETIINGWVSSDSQVPEIERRKGHGHTIQRPYWERLTPIGSRDPGPLAGRERIRFGFGSPEPCLKCTEQLYLVTSRGRSPRTTFLYPKKNRPGYLGFFSLGPSSSNQLLSL